jgi:hypothetical protein
MNKYNPSTVVALHEEIESLRQQLADHIKREVMLRDALSLAYTNEGGYHEWKETASSALAATDDLKDVRLCHAEPALYLYQKTGKTLHPSRLEESRKETWEPLYRAWEQK